MDDKLEPVMVNECIEIAAQSPLVRGATVSLKEFDEALRFAWDDRENDWLKTSIAGHLARTFMGMLQLAQDTGVTAKQISAAIEAELHRHTKAIEERNNNPVDPATQQECGVNRAF